ncbi:MAG: glycosyltransferase family 39 protein [Candidatus Daviesbacteria bacterium]|nr:glycosyltransferase family 39 protein [Candidatus Daviesbacteria bacterium]
MRVNNWLIILLLFAFIVRIVPVSFPDFTSDEARIAYRAFVLSNTGKDELGRAFPLLFNSLGDYQLPIVSYITTLGVLIFGKTDIGVRIPFILIGTAIVLLIYQLSRFFMDDIKYSLFAAALASLSPGLIFFSKFPNEYIVTTFLTLVLITQILREKVSILSILVIVLLMLLVSKALWFILLPVLLLTLFLNKKIKKREKILFFAVGLIPTVIIIFLYLNIQQGIRSLIENNFPIIYDVNIKNGIEKLRSQEAFGWPAFFDRVLFNKAYFIVTGIFHWFSELSLSRFFAELDSTGNFGYLKLGAFSKLVIIPFFVGLTFLIKGRKLFKSLILYILLVTFPLAFLYPVENIGFILFALPFIALISALGLKIFNQKIAVIFFIILIAEFLVNLWFIQASIKNSNQYRQGWIKKVIQEADAYASNYNIAFSDNLTEDIIPFIEWYTEFRPEDGYEDIKLPYKFHQTRVSNFRLIVSESTFYDCGLDRPPYIFASERDFKKIQEEIKVLPQKLYKNYLGEEMVYLLPPKVCVH